MRAACLAIGGEFSRDGGGCAEQGGGPVRRAASLGSLDCQRRQRRQLWRCLLFPLFLLVCLSPCRLNKDTHA